MSEDIPDVTVRNRAVCNMTGCREPLNEGEEVRMYGVGADVSYAHINCSDANLVKHGIGAPGLRVRIHYE